MPLHANPVLLGQLTANLRLLDPLTMNTNFSFRPEITQLLGGGTSSLNGFDTTVIPRPYMMEINITIEGEADKMLQKWLARTKTSADIPSDPGTIDEADFRFVLPLNWDLTENNVIWERKG